MALVLLTPAHASDIEARFELDLRTHRPLVPAQLQITQSRGQLRELVLDGARVVQPAGDGQIFVEDGRVRWRPPPRGGTLRYQVPLTHQRKGKSADSYDAWLDDRFGVFRGEDAFPIQSWRRTRGSTLTSELSVALPKGWSVITPYLQDSQGHLPIRNPGTRMARPLGWIAAGELGTRRDVIEGVEITVTAPRGLHMERIAMLGLLRWTLPEIVPMLAGKSRPRYISIVSAGAPMWLGALSAPNSIFVHANRPLISENGTSTIVHEMVHVLLTELDTPRDQDWIDEGLAEYLALRALKDSGTISTPRFEASVAKFRSWGSSVRSLRTASATGPVTARAVTIFHNLDTELRQATGGQQTVGSVVRNLLQAGELTDLATLRTVTRGILKHPARALSAGQVPGFD